MKIVSERACVCVAETRFHRALHRNQIFCNDRLAAICLSSPSACVVTINHLHNERARLTHLQHIAHLDERITTGFFAPLEQLASQTAHTHTVLARVNNLLVSFHHGKRGRQRVVDVAVRPQQQRIRESGRRFRPVSSQSDDDGDRSSTHSFSIGTSDAALSACFACMS
jgi:hypothetical protein